MSPRAVFPRPLARALMLLAGIGIACVSHADPIAGSIAQRLSALGPIPLETGVLYDRVLPLSGIERLSGAAGAPAVSAATFRQLCDELRRAADDPSPFPRAEALRARGRITAGPVPLVVVDARYERLRREAVEGGAGPRVETRQVFAAAALVPHTWRGAEIAFVLDAADVFGNARGRATSLEIDADDGLGYRRASFGTPVVVRYATPGGKAIRIRLGRDDGSMREAAAAFAVEALAAPLPHDTLHVTASESWLGAAASGEAYVYYAPGHTSLVNPVIVIEGFDVDDAMHWDELYAQLNGQNLLETLRAQGYDAVVLDFGAATDHLPRNGLLVAELIRQVGASTPLDHSLAVVGASMGGLCARYALAHLEQLGQWPRVRTFISFDAPHLGADIPLGIQYWVNFFAEYSTEAAHLRDLLQTPAARQMLLHHFTTPPTAAAPDPMRAQWLADLAAAGDWPTAPRLVTIANGGGSGIGQGFAPGQQIVAWNYSSFLVGVTGNVWAVPAAGSVKIFDGRLRITFITDKSQAVTVNGTVPWDGAPGGWRATMAEMDAVAAPYGDIVALAPNHCFIPTVSALALGGVDPFTPILGNAALLAATPFDAVYLPAANQGHVTVTPENAPWFLSEIPQGPVVSSEPEGGALGLSVSPHPFAHAATIVLRMPAAGRAAVRVHDVAGRTVRTLFDGGLTAGSRSLTWDGRDDGGRSVAPGVYLVRLESQGRATTKRLARVE